MSVTRVVELEVRTSGLEGGVKKATDSLNEFSEASDETKNALKALGVESETSNKIFDKTKEIYTDVSAVYRSGVVVLKSLGLMQKVNTAAQWLWNAAMAANPIGLIVAAVVALIAAGYALVTMFQNASAAAEANATANKKLNTELENQQKLMKRLNEEMEISAYTQLKMAKASGASAKEIRKLAEELANQEVQQKVANAETLRAIALEARRVASLEGSTDADKATALASNKAFQESIGVLKDSIKVKRRLLIDNQAAELQEQTDGDKKAIEQQKKASDEALKARQKANEERKKQLEKEQKEAIDSFFKQVQDEANRQDGILKIRESYKRKFQDLEDDTELKKINRQEEDALKELETLKATEEEKNEVKKYYNELRKDDALKVSEDIIKAEEEQAKAQKEIDDLKAQAKIQNLEVVGNALSVGADLLGENTAAGKIAALASAGISTYLSAQQAYASQLIPGDPTSPIRAALAAGVAVAAGLANVKKILSVKVPGGKGGGASAPSAGSAPSAPSFNITGATGLDNQIATGLGTNKQEPVKAYVVAGEVTTQQSLDRNIVNNASL